MFSFTTFHPKVTHLPRRIALKWTKSLNGAKMHPLKLTYNFKLVFLLGPSYKYLLDDLWWENRTASSVRGEPIPAKTWLRDSFSFWGSQKPRVFHINKRTILSKTNLDIRSWYIDQDQQYWIKLKIKGKGEGLLNFGSWVFEVGACSRLGAY